MRFVRDLLAALRAPEPPRFNATFLSSMRNLVGRKELPGALNDPLIMAALTLDASWPTSDEVPWCSAIANLVCMVLGLPRSKDLRARSWLRVGHGVTLAEAQPGFDVVVFKQTDDGPGPEVVDAPGHVAAFERLEGDRVVVTGGNQGDAISTASFPASRVIGVRRLFGF